MSNTSGPDPSSNLETYQKSKRNLVGFWLLGLFNNFAYVIMLSAAHDLLREEKSNPTENLNLVTRNSSRDCNELSTGTILLADIIPAILIKSVAPFLAVNIHMKVTTVTVLSALSFFIVSFSQNNLTTYIGVICASLSSGLGEVTFLSYTSFFQENVISAWSSGTGGSGVIGAGSYAALTALGVSPQTTVLIMIIVPLGMGITFWGLLKPKENNLHNTNTTTDTVPLLDSEDQTSQEGEHHTETEEDTSQLTVIEKLKLVKSLLKYMIPLGLVYFFEYLINQGLFELVYFPEIFLNHSQQYRWYQLIYQVGVLISRSSLGIIVIKKIYLMSVFQGVNMIIFTFQAIFWLLPNTSGIYFVFLFIFWEGLLGGAAYVNTFHRISQESKDREREFSLGISSVADSSAIGLAGIVALPLHNWICKLPTY
eukprot:GFUD01034989.1.p1 GENE.GFUD01034989.1~~GFUD01034989.1.p1  ORF type:complete len:425 (-),score=70.86 GFUD01034989.1:138-1412(-)